MSIIFILHGQGSFLSTGWTAEFLYYESCAKVPSTYPSSLGLRFLFSGKLEPSLEFCSSKLLWNFHHDTYYTTVFLYLPENTTYVYLILGFTWECCWALAWWITTMMLVTCRCCICFVMKNIIHKVALTIELQSHTSGG